MKSSPSLGFYINSNSEIQKVTQADLDQKKIDLVEKALYTQVRTLESDNNSGHQVSGEFVLYEKLEDLMTVIRLATGIDIKL